MLDVCQVSWTGSFRCLIVSLYNFKWYFKQIIHMNRGQWLGMNFNSRKASTVPICLNIWYANIWKWKKIRTPVFFLHKLKQIRYFFLINVLFHSKIQLNCVFFQKLHCSFWRLWRPTSKTYEKSSKKGLPKS